MDNDIKTNKKEEHFGPIIGSVIIVILIILGGLYFWKSLIKENKVEENKEQVQNTNTDLTSVTKELEDITGTSTDETIDQELQEIEKEIDAAIGN